MGTVLVTGAGGYIGSVLVERLLRADYSVCAVDRFFFGLDKLPVAEKLRIIREDSRRLTVTLFKDVDYVIDLVSISNDPAAELFSKETLEINCQGRIKTAKLARDAGVKRYVLPSSASVYGYNDKLVDEDQPPNPLTVYARANEKAERGVLLLAEDDFTVTVVRQATVFGCSPRMRFDLAVNNMAYTAWKDQRLPLMRDGKQFRPMVHIDDVAELLMLLLTADVSVVNGQVYNVGSEANNFQIEKLGRLIADLVGKRTGKAVEIEWYGDPDRRHYRLSFEKIYAHLDWKASRSVEQGVDEILDALERGTIEKNDRTLTLEWYRMLIRWHKVIKEVELYDGILEIE